MKKWRGCRRLSELYNMVSYKVLSIRRTRKEEVLLVLKKGGDVSTFHKELDRAVGERAEISALVLKRSLVIRDLDETVEKEEVVSALCMALGRPALDGSCMLFTSYGGVQTAVSRPRCLTCLDRGKKDIAHVSDGGSCPIFRDEFQRLRGRN